MKKKYWKQQAAAWRATSNKNNEEAESYWKTLRALWETKDPDMQRIILSFIPNFRLKYSMVITNDMIREWYEPQLKRQILETRWLFPDPTEPNSLKSMNSDGEQQVLLNVKTRARSGCDDISSPSDSEDPSSPKSPPVL